MPCCPVAWERALNNAGLTGSLQGRGRWGREEPCERLKMLLGKGSGRGAFALDCVLTKRKGNSMIFLMFFSRSRRNKAGKGDFGPFLWFGQHSCFCLSLERITERSGFCLAPSWSQSDLIFVL